MYYKSARSKMMWLSGYTGAGVSVTTLYKTSACTYVYIPPSWSKLLSFIRKYLNDSTPYFFKLLKGSTTFPLLFDICIIIVIHVHHDTHYYESYTNDIHTLLLLTVQWAWPIIRRGNSNPAAIKNAGQYIAWNRNISFPTMWAVAGQQWSLPG